jgi:opacity protein-like surface antigen
MVMLVTFISDLRASRPTAAPQRPHLVVSVGLVCLALGAGSALAQDGAYFDAYLGYGYSPEQSLAFAGTEIGQGLGALASRQAQVAGDAVKSFGAAFGYKFDGLPLRLELGFDHQADFDLDANDSSGASYFGQYQSTAALAGLKAELPLGPGLLPYLGAQLGYAWNDGAGLNAANLLGQTGQDRQIARLEGNGALAWGLEAGVAFPVTAKTVLELGYGYSDRGSLDLSQNFAGSWDDAGTEKDTSGQLTSDALRLRDHRIKLGLRHAFGRDERPNPMFDEDMKVASHYAVGYGQGHLEYMTTDVSGSPNIKAETKAKSMRALVLESGWQVDQGLFLVDAQGRFGLIMDGRHSRVAYAGDDRTAPTTYVTGEVLDDYWLSANLALGHSFDTTLGKDGNSLSQSLSLIPMLGVRAAQQRARFSGSQVKVGTGAGSALYENSLYDARWFTGWAGGEAALQGADYRIALRGEFHRGLYDAKANWSRALDLPQPTSFEHRSDDAWGTTVSLQAERDLGNGLRLVLGGEVSEFWAVNGDNTGSYAGSTNPQLGGKLKSAYSEIFSVNAGLVFGL